MWGYFTHPYPPSKKANDRSPLHCFYEIEFLVSLGYFTEWMNIGLSHEMNLWRAFSWTCQLGFHFIPMNIGPNSIHKLCTCDTCIVQVISPELCSVFLKSLKPISLTWALLRPCKSKLLVSCPMDDWQVYPAPGEFWYDTHPTASKANPWDPEEIDNT